MKRRKNVRENFIYFLNKNFKPSLVQYNLSLSVSLSSPLLFPPLCLSVSGCISNFTIHFIYQVCCISTLPLSLHLKFLSLPFYSLSQSLCFKLLMSPSLCLKVAVLMRLSILLMMSFNVRAQGNSVGRYSRKTGL